uniref:Uncharacterized protein n=2 Tax=Anguilla anguilla TaxID=7936 RepID=A0A0E9SZS9_ANGAN
MEMREYISTLRFQVLTVSRSYFTIYYLVLSGANIFMNISVTGQDGKQCNGYIILYERCPLFKLVHFHSVDKCSRPVHN